MLADLFAALDRGRIEPHLAVPRDGPLPARARELGITVHTVPIGGATPFAKALSVPRAVRALRAVAGACGARLLYANTMIAGYAAVLAQRGDLPCLWHLHVVTRSAVARWALRRAAAVVTPSRAGALAVDAHLAVGARLTVVPNGVPDEFFATCPGGLRRELGLPAATALVGVVGRIDPHKGHRVLLDAVASLDGAADAPHVVVAGGESFADSQARIGGYTEVLRSYAQRLGLEHRVHFLGHRSDTPRWLGELDVVVVPSVALESAPRTIAEAQAAARPVVASAIGGIPESIETDRTGVLVAPGDARALAAALAALLRDPAQRTRLGEAARRHALANYAMPRFAERMTAVCERVAGAGR